MSDEHGMQDFSDATQQGGFGSDENGNWADVSDGAISALDAQRILPGMGSMALSTARKGNEWRKLSSSTTDPDTGAKTKVNWNDWEGRKSALDQNLAEKGTTRDELLKKHARGVVGLDPLKWLAGTLVEFLVQTFQPLEDLLGVVTGNEHRMLTSAQMWQEVADAMPPISDYITSTAEAELAGWVGTDADTARTRAGELSLIVSGMGYLAMGIETVLEMMASVARMLRKLVQMLITEGVVWVIERIAPQIAASIATFGAAAPVCIAMTVAKIAGLVYDAIQAIQAVIAFAKGLAELFQLIQEMIAIFQPFIDEFINVPNFSTSGP